jgi:hypothetical protein
MIDYLLIGILKLYLRFKNLNDILAEILINTD